MNVFELFASLKLDDKEFEKGLTEAEKNAHKVGEGIGNALKGGATLVGGAVKGVGVVAAGAAAAITPLVKNAVDAYGETQQLVGGIETLFGTGGKSLEEYAASVGKSVDEARAEYEALEQAQQTMLDNANNAFATSGQTANQYMQNVTSFAASLIQSAGRGAQTDIDELTKNLDTAVTEQKRAYQDEYDNAKKALSDQVDLQKAAYNEEYNALKDSWDARIKVAKENKDPQLDALKEQKEAELKALKDSQDASIQSMKDANAEQLKELKRGNEDKLAQLKQDNKDLIAETEKANSYSEKTPQSMARAAQLADMAMIDMSDNANKMGTSMESIQNAYQGFAKGQYMLLDNLKLGYGGTKTEMERLLADAEAISGVHYDVSSYADIVEAIHIIQTEMGITGTTAEEAQDTITGSLGQVKAAWGNLVAGLANPEADLGTLIDNVVKTGSAALENLKPTILQAIRGITELIKQITPIVVEEIPKLVDELLPPFLEVTFALISAVASAIPKYIPMIIDKVKGIIPLIGKAISDTFPQLSFIGDNLETIIKTIVGVFTGGKIIGGILSFISTLSGIIPAIGGVIAAIAPAMAAALPVIAIIGGIVAAGVLLYKNWDKIKEKAGELKEKVSKSWDNLKEKTSKAWGNVKESVSGAFDGIKKNVKDKWNEIALSYGEGGGGVAGVTEVVFDQIAFKVKDALKNIGDLIGVDLSGYYDKFREGWFKIRNNVVETISNIQDKISETFTNIKNTMSENWDSIKNKVSETWNSIKDKVSDTWNGIKDKIENSAIAQTVSKVWDSAKANISESLTSIKQAYDEHGGGLEGAVAATWEGIKQYYQNAFNFIDNLTDSKLSELGTKFNEGLTNIKNKVSEIWDTIKNTISNVWTSIKDTASTKLSGLHDTIKNKLTNLWNSFTNFSRDAKDVFSRMWDGIKRIFDFSAVFDWGKDLIDNFVGGIKQKWGTLKDSLGNFGQTISDYIGFSEPKKGVLSNFHTYAPDMVDLFVKGIKDNTAKLQNQLNDSFAFEPTLDANMKASGTGGMSTGGTVVNMPINIYGAQGQDIRELADIIEQRINHNYNVLSSAYGVG